MTSKSVTVNGVQLNYVDVGEGPETVVLSHGYLMSHRMYDHQIAALSKHARVIAFDHRCHGGSQDVRTPFGMYDLVDDAADLIRATCDGPVHFAGMSTGGFVGMRLVLRHPDLIKSLTLIDTSAGIEKSAPARRNTLLLTVVKYLGFRPVVNKVLGIMMGQAILTDPARRDVVDVWRKTMLSLDREAARQFGFAIFGRDAVLDDLKTATTPPTLIIVGEEDQPTPVSDARDLHGAIAGSDLVVVPRSGHSSPVEEPEVVTKAMLAFYDRVMT